MSKDFRLYHARLVEKRPALADFLEQTYAEMKAETSGGEERVDAPLKDDDLAVYETGFTVPYRGEFCEGLLTWFDEWIDKANRGVQIYSFFTAIVQSSGFGKTRSLVELSKKGVFVFYMNLQDNKGAGYPLRSKEADNFSIKNEEEGYGFLLAVLTQLDEYIKKQLEKRKELESLTADLQSLTADLRSLTAALQSLRNRVDKLKARKSKEETALERSKIRQKIREKKKQRREKEEEVASKQERKETLQMETGTSISSAWTADQVGLSRGHKSKVGASWHEKWTKEPASTLEKVKEVWERLGELDQFREGNGSGSEWVKVLFVLDEITVLFRDASGLSPPYYIRRCFQHIPGLFCAVVDTKAQIPVVASEASLDPSLSIVSGAKSQIPLYFQVKTIYRPRPSVDDGKEDLTLEELYKFGRPLWTALLEANTSVEKLKTLALRKLLGGTSEAGVAEVKKGDVTLKAAMAVLSARLSLAVVPQSYLASALGGGYMSPLIDISDDRTSVTIMDAWDPVLSAAAKYVFDSEKFRVKALEHVVKACQDYLIDEGKSGELVGRYIIMRARDRAEKADGSATVEDFLTQLMGPDFMGNDDPSIKAAAEVGKGYKLNFDSFMPIEFTPQDGHLKEAYLLRKALICRPLQSRFDAIVPMMGQDNRLSMLGLQFKSYRDEKNFESEGGEYMDPLLAGIGEFPKFVTVLLQVHPRVMPKSQSSTIERVEGARANLNKKQWVKRQMSSTQAAYWLDGLEAVCCLEKQERSQLAHLLACRRMKEIMKKGYYQELQCMSEEGYYQHLCISKVKDGEEEVGPNTRRRYFASRVREIFQEEDIPRL